MINTYGITFNDRFGSDTELRKVILRVERALERYSHMGMESRIKSELDKRAHIGGLNEENTLAHADLRNRLMLESDLEALRKSRNS